MVEFLCGIYRKLLDFIAFVFLIVSAIIGAIIFGAVNSNLVILGIILGLVIGFLTEALIFPPLAILFTMDEKLQNLEIYAYDLPKIKEAISTGYVNRTVTSSATAKPVHSAFLFSDYKDSDFENKEEWISRRILKLIDDGYNAADAKAQAEAEYVVALIEKAHEADHDKKVEEAKKNQVNNPGHFSYVLHEEKMSSFMSAKDLVNYLESLNITDAYFNEEVLPKIKEISVTETFKSKKIAKALDLLKELTK